MVTVNFHSCLCNTYITDPGGRGYAAGKEGEKKSTVGACVWHSQSFFIQEKYIIIYSLSKGINVDKYFKKWKDVEKSEGKEK